MKDVESHSVDLIATDPPYEISFDKQSWDKLGSLNWAFLADEFKRILKPNGTLVVFQGWSHVAQTKIILDDRFTLKNWIIYDRVKGRGAKHNLVSTREDILWYVCNENTYTYNKISSTIKKKTGGSIGKKNGNPYRALSNVWTDIAPIVPWSRERVKHPTQKPLDIMLRIISIFSNVGDVVLDPFCGSGTTGVAAQQLNREFIGFEKEKAYWSLSLERMSSHE
ncbi:MAG: site-specific DNA-methyltransferase [Alphaproteobacteria bacterium GM202ARS2]|nr:site-specific DNA-methyltransferase [Alphaproteobacteria bacterium GM202ARS2]